MTLQDLLKQQSKPLSNLDAEKKQAQIAKTAQLIAANKAAAAQILKATLLKLDSDSPISRKVERQIWI